MSSPTSPAARQPESGHLRVGTAGWALPKAERDHFAGDGSQLERYATRFRCVEINSTFRRTHRRATYERWASAVPSDFRFSVKLPKAITHEHLLIDTQPLVEEFIASVGGLGTRLGCLLVQLPPKLAIDEEVATAFFSDLRARFTGDIVVEPRHGSWMSANVDRLLASVDVGRVGADPAINPAAARPGGSSRVAYYRLHGSPRTYYSSYGDDYLSGLATTISDHVSRNIPVWCVFDNTVLGAATANALHLLTALEKPTVTKKRRKR